MMKKGLWIVAGSVVLGFSLLAHAPARLVVPERFGKLQFIGIDGSVWRGEVEQILYSGRALPVRDLAWTVEFSGLFNGTFRAEFFERGTAENRGFLVVDLLSLQPGLQELHWQFPGSSLDPWYRAGVSMQGDFELDLQILQFPENGLFPSRVQGRLDWQKAALRMDSQIWQIGSPLMQFSGEGGAIKGIVTNSEPLLPGDSSFQCTSTSCQVEMSLQPTPDAPQSLTNGLLLLGLQQEGDRYSGQINVAIR